MNGSRTTTIAGVTLIACYLACGGKTLTHSGGASSGADTSAATSATTLAGGNTGSTTAGTAGAGGAATADAAGAGGSASAAAGTGGSACKTPGTLHPPMMGATATIYCPFSGMNGGKNVYCTKQSQHCCEPTKGTSTCVSSKTACGAGDTDWTCEDPTDCPQSQKCCSNDGAMLVINPDPNCASYATSFHGTVCAATCSATQIQLCTSDAECGAKKCVPFSTKGNQVGACH